MIFNASACSSEALKVSHVLDTLGIDNTLDDVKNFLTELPRVMDRLKKISPLTGAGQIDQFRYRKQ